MISSPVKSSLLSPCLLLLLAVTPLNAAELVLEPVADNSLYESPADQGENQFEVSNGGGQYLFVGRTGLDAGFRLRRALLRFELDGVLPENAFIIHAELTLNQSKAAPGSPPAGIGLYPLLAEWGEGSTDATGPEGQGAFAQAGDATWHNRFYPDTAWNTPGGDFAETADSMTTVGSVLGDYTWPCTPALLKSIHDWRYNPGNNLGWLLVGGEEAGFSAHRFGSREQPEAVNRPRLRLVYTTEIILRDGFDGFSCAE